MKFLAVSTFNVFGRECYGQRMMDSFHQHWPSTVPLRVYAEGWKDTIPEASVYDLIASSPWLADFKERHAGRTFKNFRWDAVRFSHKVAALCHAARTCSAQTLIWLDGDIGTHAPVSEADLAALAPSGDDWIAWLDRAGNYPECGFYMLNVRHPRHAEMIDRFEAMYAQDGLFGLREWHDSYVLQQVVNQAGVGTKSLSGEGRTTSHPLVNGPLGRFCDHLKGSRKAEGRSRPTDLRVVRTEGYWQ